MGQTRDFDLRIPPQQPPAPSSFDCRPRAVRDWLKALPLGNIGATSRTLYEMLTQVNHLSLPVRARLSLLEQLHPVLSYTLAGLQRHYHGQPLPLPARTVLVAELAISLLEEMARGYRIILAHSAQQRLSGRLLARSFQRCGYYMGLALLESYATYLRAPKGLWRTFHALYAQAQSLRLEDVQVADAQPADGRTSLAARYKQALLLAAAGPYRLRPQEIRAAHRLLSRVAAFCELKAGNELRLRGGFRFDSAGDTRPPTGARGDAACSASERVLLTGAALEQRKRRPPQPSPPQRPPPLHRSNGNWSTRARAGIVLSRPSAPRRARVLANWWRRAAVPRAQPGSSVWFAGYSKASRASCWSVCRRSGRTRAPSNSVRGRRRRDTRRCCCPRATRGRRRRCLCTPRPPWGPTGGSSCEASTILRCCSPAKQKQRVYSRSSSSAAGARSSAGSSILYGLQSNAASGTGKRRTRKLWGKRTICFGCSSPKSR
jgi:hypothetical protein